MVTLIFKTSSDNVTQTSKPKRDLVLHLFVWTYELLRRGLRRTFTYNDVFRVNPVWLIREKVMSASRNNLPKIVNQNLIRDATIVMSGRPSYRRPDWNRVSHMVMPNLCGMRVVTNAITSKMFQSRS